MSDKIKYSFEASVLTHNRHSNELGLKDDDESWDPMVFDVREISYARVANTQYDQDSDFGMTYIYIADVGICINIPFDKFKKKIWPVKFQ